MGVLSGVSCFFSFFFCILCLSSTNFLNIWLFLELSVLSVIPCFFGNYVYLNYYKGLLYYLLLSGISSGLIFSGLLLFNESGGSLICLGGFLIKFCIFPLGFWVYIVGNSCSWPVIWLITCCSKIFCPILSVFFSSGFFFLSTILCALTLVFSGAYFWFGSSSSRIIWINMSVSSSAVLFFLFLNSDSYLNYYLLIYYLIWSSLCISNFSSSPFYTSLSTSYTMFLLYSVPLSLSFFYKLLGVVALVESPAFWSLILSFFLYGISEQYYLFKSWGFSWSVQDGKLLIK
uniref:NADH dehydrogenase subunit 2 n=1 Tax=Capsala martinieri TaxID=119074 RepID=UPI002008EBFF|nr:NADH dehydrogenase subunit 2 [Capsala martinieri]UOX29722.1 NADH dehydrogenase subunit 2 [Capsala martinieri]